MQLKNLDNLVILCGGTGGHFYPGLTIARKLLELKHKKCCLAIGGHKDKFFSQQKEAEKYGIEVRVINSARLSKNPIKLIIFFICLLKGFFKARKLLKRIKPDAVLGMGSFTSAPVSFAAISLGIPLFLHDGNARIGKANLFFSKWAKITMSAFPAVNKDQLKSDYKTTGMPLRSEIINNVLSKEDALSILNKRFKINFKKGVPTLLIFGGSQGAATINRVLPNTLKSLGNRIQAIHIFGSTQNNSIYKKMENVLILESSSEMNILYSAADIVISRSGGSTIAELLFYKKPAILIPYPLAPDLHQNDNAEYYKKNVDSEILLNNDCTEKMVEELIIKMINKTSSYAKPGKHSNQAEEILRTIDNTVK